MVVIRRAEMDDIPGIMEFMDDHWLKNYALAVDREFFDWQFVKGDVVNVWIAVDDVDGKIYAMEGAIFYNDAEHTDLATTMWIATECELPFVGMRLSEQLLKEVDGRAGFALGLSEKAAHIQRRLHKPVFGMDHFYRLNDLEEYRVAKVVDKDIPEVSDSGYRLSAIFNPEDIRKTVSPEMLTMYSPHKSYEYIVWRYLEHTIFHYDLWRIINAGEEPVGMLVTREEEANGRKSAKIVDYYGDNNEIGKIGFAVDSMLRDKGYEFIDVYSFGVDVREYEMAGMVRCDDDSKNVIPNYFQPYACQNTPIYMIKPLVEDARLFRGDADQDKPRFVP